MASQARYEVLIPTGQLAQEAARYISGQLAGASASVEPHREVYNDGVGEYFDVLHVVADASPQADSTLKQLGVYLAEVTGRSPIVVSKHDKGGIQVWPMQHKGPH